jgi:hypothetical protein
VKKSVVSEGVGGASVGHWRPPQANSGDVSAHASLSRPSGPASCNSALHRSSVVALGVSVGRDDEQLHTLLSFTHSLSAHLLSLVVLHLPVKMILSCSSFVDFQGAAVTVLGACGRPS